MIETRQELGLLVGACLVAGLVLSVAARSAGAAEVDYEVAFRYPHVWRGITLREFPILSASSTVSHESGFAVNVWIGLDLSDDNGRAQEIQEVDIDLHYNWGSDRLDLTLGYVELIFPGGIDNTGEAYFRVQSSELLSPSLEVFYNVDLLQDVFVKLNLKQRWSLARTLSASLKGTVAYSGEEYSRFFGGTASGLHHWETTFDLDCSFESRTVKFRLAYTDNLDPNVLVDQNANFWGGVYFSVAK